MAFARTAVDASSYVIIGNGIAGITAAEILRSEDTTAGITVIADDPFPAYYRPALKDYLAGRVREDKLWARHSNFYQDHNIRFLADRVTGIQVAHHALELQSGGQLGYQTLLLAQGARARSLSCSGVELRGVKTLRTVADYQQVEHELSRVRRIVVAGSGTLALETLETLRHRGYQVVHLLRRPTLWSEVLDATASDLVLQQEKRDGVDVRVEGEIAEVMGKNGQVSGVITTSGTQIACEMVLIAIGIDPIIDFVKHSGIPCGRGITVDAEMHTAAPDIYAAGDVLETTDALTGRKRIIGQWYPAIQQARAAAYAMLGILDTQRPFHSSTFYNATFLYGLDFASVGMTTLHGQSEGYQELIAEPQPRMYRKIILKNGRPVGALGLGDRQDVMAYKRAIDHQVDLTPVVSRLFAPDFRLDAWLDKQGVPAPIVTVSRSSTVSTRASTLGTATSDPSPSITEARLVPELNTGRKPSPMLKQTEVMTVGRQVGVHVLIDDGTVSRRHAEICYANGAYTLKDLGSSNGTFLNGTRLEAGHVYPLKADDRLRFGKTATYIFQLKELREREQPQRQATGLSQLLESPTAFFDASELKPLVPLSQPHLNADGSLQLPGASEVVSASVLATLRESPGLIVIKEGVPEVFPLRVPGRADVPQGKKRLTIGRDRKNDVVLADTAVSRQHAEIFPSLNGFYIRDLRSSNGVLVNHTRITNPYQLTHGDRIGIGSSACYFVQLQALPTLLPVAVSTPSRACSTCGLKLENPAARFCPFCGSPLGQAFAEGK